MINKIRKFLLEQSEITFFKKNQSGSEYFQFENVLIRLSNHMTKSNNKCKTFNIIVNGDIFMAFFNNMPLKKIQTYDDFETRFMHYVEAYDNINEIYVQSIKQELMSATKTSTPKKKKTPKKKEEAIFDELSKTMIYLGETFDCAYTSDRHWEAIKKHFKSEYRPTTLEKTKNTLKGYDKDFNIIIASI